MKATGTGRSILKVLVPILLGSVGVFAVIAVAGPRGQIKQRLSAFAGGPVAEPLAVRLPPVTLGAMTITPVAGNDRGLKIPQSLSVLSFDDGTCESGLGAGITVTDLVNFDVPTQCVQSGLDIVGLTARVNTGSGTAFAFAQAGATPPPAGAASTVALGTAIPPFGGCPGSAPTALTTRAIGPGAAVITGTSNFFAGLRTPGGFVGRDTDGAPAGRQWLLCAGCGNTQYSPTLLTNIGLGGNWMIRVTVEDENCVPVELGCGEGDCFAALGVPGCGDTCGGDSCPGCCDAVCGYDPFCCNVEWDGICATEASTAPGLCLPLYVELEYFTARVEDGAVVLRWKTITEVDNVGFRILRLRDPGDAESLRIVTPQLIPAQGNELAGATYEHVDGSTRGAGKFYYFLEDTDVHGVATLHGPVSVAFRPKPASGLKR